MIDRAIEQFETAFNDDSESVKKWLYPIAKQGNAPAQLYLAILFLDDDGGGIAPLAKNRAEGMRWLRRVAAQGELTSHMLLIHEASEGGDDTEVEKWCQSFDKIDMSEEFAKASRWRGRDGIPSCRKASE